ncbi:transketolase [candidate division KSB3 bacterium]|uniref:Transketolase n=1 Tax=candidate division KSB3 bacterium TaxID=2044937 RepID=A0A9D5JSR2_9BACT|nr:transketolase [candidate division KSB3 bacterium]MBD3323567.1 transketolase [candidate division KSB3 bacterium]
MPDAQRIDELCINTIRTLAMDGVQKANSGHPGAPMGMAPMAYTLWTRFLKHNPANPDWPDRDRFVLSAGHASMLIYSLLYLTGYDVSLEDLKQFRQWGSKTPGHPEYGLTPGVETTTGPLGQGLAMSVGMAMAERVLAQHFNRPEQAIVDHYTYVFAGDGDMMEGVSSEAASLAGHLKLGKLICLYDDNSITIEGETDLAFTEDVGRRFEAYGWHVRRIESGTNIQVIASAIESAQKETDRPSLICIKTHIAHGSPNKQDTAGAHGSPLGEDEIALTKEALGWTHTEPFFVPEDALNQFRTCVEEGAASENAWKERFDAYQNAYPELAKEWEMMLTGTLPDGLEALLPEFPVEKPLATRAASGQVVNALADQIPALIGGSADLAPSNNTLLKAFPDFSSDNYAGRNVRYGVREHAMGAILNGLSLHGGLLPYGGTFLVFSDYMRPAIRLAALMERPVVYVFTHDSIGLGEDGPTHQPIEHLAALRAIPNLTVIRPADATETAAAWKVALEQKEGPTALALSRQKLPILDRTQYPPADMVAKGAYILAEAKQGSPALILIATGSEVSLALDAQQQLEAKGTATRVVSMPSWELFEAQPQAYKEEVFPPDITARLAIEAGSPQGWRQYVGENGDVVGIETFGASAPAKVLLEKYGFTVDNIVARSTKLLT